MKTYSLYLSSLAGCNTESIFNATVAGSTLTVVSVSQGTVAPAQFVSFNGVINMIIENGTGTGAAGTYSLLNAVSADNATENTYISYSQSGSNAVGSNASLFQGLIVSGVYFPAAAMNATTAMTFPLATVGLVLAVGMRVVCASLIEN